MSSKTRLCRKEFFRDTDPDGLYNCLMKLGKELPRPGVLIPSGDAELLCISQRRADLSEYFKFRVPDAATVDLLANKTRFYEFARETGISLPRTCTNPTAVNIEEIAEDFVYPCLIKPSLPDANWSSHFGTTKAVPANSPSELVAVYKQVSAVHADVLIQEIVPGPDHNLYFSHIYLSDSFETLAMWTGRKLRQRPIHFGTSTLTETVESAVVAEASLKILNALQCPGYSSIEFKFDERDRQHKIMEVTHGRTWYPHYLGFGAGVNIPEIWYKDLIGEPTRSAQAARIGVRWIDEYRDPFACYEYWKAGELSVRDWVASLRGLGAFVYSSINDPLPILSVVARLVLTIPRGIIRRITTMGARK